MRHKKRRCAVGNCNSVGNVRALHEETGKILFKFPSPSVAKSHPETYQKWMDFVREHRPDFKPHMDSYLCSDHFTYDCLALSSILKMQFGMNERPLLKADAYPNIQKEVTIQTKQPDASRTKSLKKMSLKENNVSKPKPANGNFQKGKAKEAKSATKTSSDTIKRLKSATTTSTQLSNASQSAKSTNPYSKTARTKRSVTRKSSATITSSPRKTAKMTSLKSKSFTTRTTKISTFEENSSQPGKRPKRTLQKNNPSKKRKISHKPEVVIERWQEEDEEEGPPEPKITTPPKILKKIDQHEKEKILKEYYQTTIDPHAPSDFSQFKSKSKSTSASPWNPSERSVCQTGDLEMPFGPIPDPADVCKLVHPEISFELKKDKFDEQTSPKNDRLKKNAVLFEKATMRVIKQESGENGGPSIDLVDMRIPGKEFKVSGCHEDMLVELPLKRSESYSVDLPVENTGLPQDSSLLDANEDTPVAGKGPRFDALDMQGQSLGHKEPSSGTAFDGKGSTLNLQGQNLGHDEPSCSTGFDGKGSSVDLQDSNIGVKDSTGFPGELPGELADNSDTDSDIALPMDEEQNIIFCCSTCGDVQPVEGEPRLVICNDMTMKTTRTLNSEVMSVFCEKCSTESESCFQCNDHIERGFFKDHLKLHFG